MAIGTKQTKTKTKTKNTEREIDAFVTAKAIATGVRAALLYVAHHPEVDLSKGKGDRPFENYVGNAALDVLLPSAQARDAAEKAKASLRARG